MFVRRQRKLVPAHTLGQRSETVRRANLGTIARELHLHGALTRSELVARTGLTRTAIRALIGELMAAGLVSEERAESHGAPGRPSPVVRANPSGAVVLALEIAVDSLAVALVGLGGTIFEIVRVDRPRGRFSVDETVADLVELAGACSPIHPPTVPSWASEWPSLASCAARMASSPSPRTLAGRTLHWANAARGAALDCPVAVADEADLGALAEVRRGAAADAQARALHLRRGRRRRRADGGRRAVHRRRRLRWRGRPHAASMRMAWPAAAGSVGCWETRSRRGCAPVRAGHTAGGRTRRGGRRPA